MSDPINEMFPSGGGMRGEPALVCVTYDSNGDPCGISGLPDFAENYVEALAAERDRLAAQLATARAEGWRQGIEAAAEEVKRTPEWRFINVWQRRDIERNIRALPMPADMGSPA